MRIYTLAEKFNKTSNTSIYKVEHVITLRSEDPQPFDKFGAVAESDGQNMLWISSGWANDEAGMVWSYNVQHGLSKARDRELEQLLENDQESQVTFNMAYEQYEVAQVFAQGREPKVAPLGD